MKKLVVFLCVLALLFASTGVVFAERPQPAQFTITGTTDPSAYQYRVLPSGRTIFTLTSTGVVEGYFTGTFVFQEWGNLDFNPETGAGTGKGVNTGIMTITTQDGSQVVIWYGGLTDLYAVDSVTGHFTVLSGTGTYRNLHGQGTYAGGAGFEFTVVFTGRFHQ